MLHEASKPSKTLLYNFATREFVSKPEFSVQIPVAPANETEQHASNKGVTRADGAREDSVE